MLFETDKLNQDAIARLADGRAMAIRVKNYLPREQALKVADKILSPGYAHYLNAPSIGRIGMAFYEAENRPDMLDAYFEQAAINIDDLRQRCAPYASPIDRLRCELDEAWPAGAHLEKLYGKKMFIGLSRVVEPDVYFLAHHDILAKDAPDSYQARSLEAQFACNVYLDMPEDGGELEIWQRELPPDEFDAMRGDSYGIDPALLGEPSLRIKPESGELVIFNSRKMHAVAPSKHSSRLSLSCFIGYRGAHSPLTFWS
ncbi:2OG-Fe(II) oxygenase [Chromobacterium phragmitis]|uniref:2OG-Fe(II) oxygenase n=1 Tax=Chromobacterium phragmitis TaxID=2202141 RepID=A0A344UF72_9NEIS|nr:2OG-Fe(II) oxygenase [Chromobacterium phragmitis]AXE33920.1 hypothetical protein DK843_06115 [Chromobacterium phragmitis]